MPKFIEIDKPGRTDIPVCFGVILFLRQSRYYLKKRFFLLFFISFFPQCFQSLFELGFLPKIARFIEHYGIHIVWEIMFFNEMTWKTMWILVVLSIALFFHIFSWSISQMKRHNERSATSRRAGSP